MLKLMKAFTKQHAFFVSLASSDNADYSFCSNRSSVNIKGFMYIWVYQCICEQIYRSIYICIYGCIFML